MDHNPSSQNIPGYDALQHSTILNNPGNNMQRISNIPYQQSGKLTAMNQQSQQIQNIHGGIPTGISQHTLNSGNNNNITANNLNLISPHQLSCNQNQLAMMIQQQQRASRGDLSGSLSSEIDLSGNNNFSTLSPSIASAQQPNTDATGSIVAMNAQQQQHMQEMRMINQRHYAGNTGSGHAVATSGVSNMDRVSNNTPNMLTPEVLHAVRMMYAGNESGNSGGGIVNTMQTGMHTGNSQVTQNQLLLHLSQLQHAKRMQQRNSQMMNTNQAVIQAHLQSSGCKMPGNNIPAYLQQNLANNTIGMNLAEQQSESGLPSNQVLQSSFMQKQQIMNMLQMKNQQSNIAPSPMMNPHAQQQQQQQQSAVPNMMSQQQQQFFMDPGNNLQSSVVSGGNQAHLNEIMQSQFAAAAAKSNSNLQPCRQQGGSASIHGNEDFRNQESLRMYMQQQQLQKRINSMGAHTTNPIQLNELIQRNRQIQRVMQMSNEMQQQQQQQQQQQMVMNRMSSNHMGNYASGGSTMTGNDQPRAFAEMLEDQKLSMPNMNIQQHQMRMNQPAVGNNSATGIIMNQVEQQQQPTYHLMMDNPAANMKQQPNTIHYNPSMVPNSVLTMIAANSSNNPSSQLSNEISNMIRSHSAQMASGSNVQASSTPNNQLTGWNVGISSQMTSAACSGSNPNIAKATTPTSALEINMLSLNSPEFMSHNPNCNITSQKSSNQMSIRLDRNNMSIGGAGVMPSAGTIYQMDTSGMTPSDIQNFQNNVIVGNLINSNKRIQSTSGNQAIFDLNNLSSSNPVPGHQSVSVLSSQSYPVQQLVDTMLHSGGSNSNVNQCSTPIIQSPQNLIPMMSASAINQFNKMSSLSQSTGSLGNLNETSPEEAMSGQNNRKITDPKFIECIKRECPDPSDDINIMLKIPYGTILPSTPLSPDMNSRTYTFQVPDWIYKSIVENSNIEVILVITNGHDECVRWPDSVAVRFNGQNVENVVRDAEFGDLPLFLKPYMVSGLNELKLAQICDPSFSMYVGIMMVTNMELSGVIERMVNRRLMLTCWSIRENTIYVNREIDFLANRCQDASCDSMILSLICPVKQDIIAIPAKGENCFHVECFDMVTLMRVCHSRRVFLCPICKEPVSMEILKIDSFVWSIISDMSDYSDTSYVRISRDLKWRPIVKNELCHPTLNVNEMKMLVELVKDEIMTNSSQQISISNLVSNHSLEAVTATQEFSSNNNHPTSTVTSQSLKQISPLFVSPNDPHSASSSSLGGGNYLDSSDGNNPNVVGEMSRSVLQQLNRGNCSLSLDGFQSINAVGMPTNEGNYINNGGKKLKNTRRKICRQVSKSLENVSCQSNYGIFGLEDETRFAEDRHKPRNDAQMPNKMRKMLHSVGVMSPYEKPNDDLSSFSGTTSERRHFFNSPVGALSVIDNVVEQKSDIKFASVPSSSSQIQFDFDEKPLMKVSPASSSLLALNTQARTAGIDIQNSLSAEQERIKSEDIKATSANEPSSELVIEDLDQIISIAMQDTGNNQMKEFTMEYFDFMSEDTNDPSNQLLSPHLQGVNNENEKSLQHQNSNTNLIPIITSTCSPTLHPALEIVDSGSTLPASISLSDSKNIYMKPGGKVDERMSMNFITDTELFSSFHTTDVNTNANMTLTFPQPVKSIDEFTIPISSNAFASSSSRPSDYDLTSPFSGSGNSSTHPELDNFLREIMCLSNETQDGLFSGDCSENITNEKENNTNPKNATSETET